MRCRRRARWRRILKEARGDKRARALESPSTRRANRNAERAPARPPRPHDDASFYSDASRQRRRTRCYSGGVLSVRAGACRRQTRLGEDDDDDDRSRIARCCRRLRLTRLLARTLLLLILDSCVPQIDTVSHSRATSASSRCTRAPQRLQLPQL